MPWEHVLVDSTSATTGEHPAGIARLDGIDPATQRFLIVTTRPHSRRAAACFRHAGYRNFTVYAGRTASQANRSGPERDWRNRIMSLPMLGYECTALLRYWLQNKI